MIAYFDSNLWLAFLKGEPGHVEDVRTLLKEIKENRGRVVTSVITLIEVAIKAYRVSPAKANTYYSTIDNLATIYAVSPPIALLAAKIEGQFRVRRWDAVHLATAAHHNASVFYTFDEKLQKKDFSAEPSIPNVKKPTPAQRSFDII